MTDKLRILEAAMHREFPDGRTNAFAADELGSYEGPDIPQGLWEQQQWAGVTPAMNGQVTAPPGKPMVRIQLPRKYSRDWTIHFANPNPRGLGAFNNAGFTSTGVITLRWGHHGSFDEVQLTWPGRGGAVTVHGSFVEVLYTDTSAVNNAAACWVDEGRGSRTPMGYKPCLVNFIGTLVYGGAPAVVTLAPRCRSFAMSFVSASPASQGTIRVRQQEANANPLVDTYYTNAALAGGNLNSNVQLHETLVHHWATELQLDNFTTLDESELLNVCVLQYLDLG